MPELVSVRFRDCSCPGTPHPDGDIAHLRPWLDYASGAEVVAAMGKVGDDTSRFAELVGPVLIRRGVVAWNVLDEKGEPVPVTPAALDGLRWEDAYELADKADDLYGEQILAPLVKRMNESSKAGPTNGSTRPRRSAKPRTRSARSSSPSSASARNPT